jgi:hypothetical protein
VKPLGGKRAELASINREIQTYLWWLSVLVMLFVRGLADLYALIYWGCVAFLFVIGLHATEMVVLCTEDLQALVGLSLGLLTTYAVVTRIEQVFNTVRCIYEQGICCAWTSNRSV